MRLSRFVSVMWRRTPKHREHVIQIGKKMAPEFFEEFIEQRQKQQAFNEAETTEIERLREYYATEDLDFLFASSVLRDSVFERVMHSMDWAFFLVPIDREFLTCDDPVRFSAGSGLGHKDATIIFPLSRELLLQCKWNSGWGNNFHALTNEQVDYFNLWTVKGAHKQVYASCNSEEIHALVDGNIGTV